MELRAAEAGARQEGAAQVDARTRDTVQDRSLQAREREVGAGQGRPVQVGALQIDAGLRVGSREVETGQVHAEELAPLASARGDEEGRERQDLQTRRVPSADRRLRQARCVEIEELFRAGVEKPAVEDRARVVAEANRGGGLVECDDGARELAQVGGIERENGCPSLIVALLEERDLALLER